MVQRIDDTDGGHGPACDSQDIHTQLIEGHVVFSVHDINGLQLRIDLKGWACSPRVGATCSQGVSIFLFVLLQHVGSVIHVDWDYLQMVVEVQSLVSCLEILDNCAARNVTFQFLNVVLHSHRRVGDWQLKGFQSLPEFQFAKDVGRSDVHSVIGVNIQNQVIWATCVKGKRSRGLNCNLYTFGSFNTPSILHPLFLDTPSSAPRFCCSRSSV